MKSNLKIVLIYVVLIGVIILATASLWNTIPSEEILYSDIRAYFVKEQVKSFVIKDATLTMEIRQTDESGNLTDKTKEVKYELGDISRRLVELYHDRIDALRRAGTEHKIALNAVEEKSRMKRQLTNNINHELKTPVGVVRGYLETVLSSPDMDDTMRTHFLQRAQDNVNRLCALLGDVSTMTRLEEGAGNIPTEEIDFHDLVFAVVNDLETGGVLRNMKFTFDIPFNCAVKGNAGLLTGVVTNLAKNAALYSHGTKMCLNITAESDRYYTFNFFDDGRGVDEEHLAHLFERFYRIDSGRARKTGGTGLGLPIVKNTIEALGGTISVNNRPGGGLGFMFTLEKWGNNVKKV